MARNALLWVKRGLWVAKKRKGALRSQSCGLAAIKRNQETYSSSICFSGLVEWIWPYFGVRLIIFLEDCDFSALWKVLKTMTVMIARSCKME